MKRKVIKRTAQAEIAAQTVQICHAGKYNAANEKRVRIDSQVTAAVESTLT